MTGSVTRMRRCRWQHGLYRICPAALPHLTSHVSRNLTIIIVVVIVM